MERIGVMLTSTVRTVLYKDKGGCSNMGSRLVSVTKKTKKALLSISDGRASSFFNTFNNVLSVLFCGFVYKQN